MATAPEVPLDLGFLSATANPVLAFLRNPLIALLFGVAIPLVVFGDYGISLAALVTLPVPGSLGEPKSWFAWNTHPALAGQHLFVFAASTTMVAWIFTQSNHPFMAASLTGYTILAVLPGVITSPICAWLIMIETDTGRPMLALVAPWLAAASFGACAIESHRLGSPARPSRST